MNTGVPMNRKLLFVTYVTSVLLLTSMNAFADFNQDAGVILTQTDDDDTSSSTDTALYYRKFFKTVSTAKGPIDEAPYMQKASWVMGSYSTYDGTDSDSSSYDGTSYFISSDIYLEQAPVSIGLLYTNYETEYSTVSAETVNYQLKASYFIQPYMSVSLAMRKVELEYSGAFTGTSEVDVTTLGFKTVIPQAGGQAISVEAEHSSAEDSDGDTFTELELTGNYYLNKSMGFGLKYGQVSGDAADDTSTLGVIFSMHTNSNINIFATHDLVSGEEDGVTDATVTSVTVSYLF